jgi:uncharacterized protein YbaA (DUF1428 family)
MAYVDGFVIPLPKKNLAAYVRMARAAGKVWKEHGALEYRECIGDDLTPKMGTKKSPSLFLRMTKAKSGETVLFSWIVYLSRSHRDRVNRAVMEDPRIQRMMKGKMPFDPKRMAYGGFKTVVDL